MHAENVTLVKEEEVPAAVRWVLEEDLGTVMASVPEGLAREFIELIGLPATLTLLAHYGGLQLYVPRLEPLKAVEIWGPPEGGIYSNRFS